MDLPPKSPIIHYTLESPWPIALIAFIVGLLILRHAITRGNRRWTMVSFGVILIGPALVLAAYLVETESEVLARSTAEFIEAAVDGNRERASQFLANDLSVVVGHEGTRYTKEDVVAMIYPLPLILESNRVRDIGAVAINGRKGESVLLQTTVPHAGYPVPNRWRFEWVRDQFDSRWRIRQMIWEEWANGKVPSTDMIPRR